MKYIQIQISGPQGSDNQPTIWWDGIQVEKADQPTAFTSDQKINHFSEQFNPLDLYQATPFEAAVNITPQGRTGFATIRSSETNGIEQAQFDLHLASKPRNQVTVTLSTIDEADGKFSTESVTFLPSNWDEAQTISLSGHSSAKKTIVSATTNSADSFYNNLTSRQTIVPSSWPDDLVVPLIEGGVINPALPVVSIKAINGKESEESDFGFKFQVNKKLKQDITVIYSLNAGNGFNLSGLGSDIQNAPVLDSNDHYSITIPAGQTSAFVNLIPTEDHIDENDETIEASLISSEQYTLNPNKTQSTTATLSDNNNAGVSFFVRKNEQVLSNQAWVSTRKLTIDESHNSQSDQNSKVLGLALTSQPTDDVTLTLDSNSYSPEDLDITDPNSTSQNNALAITFTKDNWDTPQEIQINAKNSAYADAGKKVLATFNMSSSDTKYDGLNKNLNI